MKQSAKPPKKLSDAEQSAMLSDQAGRPQLIYPAAGCQVL
jgi:hypothetical protein